MKLQISTPSTVYQVWLKKDYENNELLNKEIMKNYQANAI